MKPTVLILCTGNSCRSQMAEGLLRHLAGNRIDAQSAGSHPVGYVHPLTVAVMAEIGIDLTGHKSKNLDEFLNQPIHTVLTVCGDVDQICPAFPGRAARLHRRFDDPGKVQGPPDEMLTAFRRVRDEIRCYLQTLTDHWKAEEQ